MECQDKVKTVIVDSPIEECDMEPLRTCKHITKLVPKLEPELQCVDVPKEVCARSRVNPKRVKKPSIQKWCYTPEEELSEEASECQDDSECQEDGEICEDTQCVPGNNLAKPLVTTSVIILQVVGVLKTVREGRCVL